MGGEVPRYADHITLAGLGETNLYIRDTALSIISNQSNGLLTISRIGTATFHIDKVDNLILYTTNSITKRLPLAWNKMLNSE